MNFLQHTCAHQSAQHIVGLDLDGVIVDHTKNRLRLAARLGFTLLPEDTVADVISLKLSPAAHAAIQQAIYDDPRVALTASLVEGAHEGIAWLAERGVPYRLISRRKNGQVAIELLRRHNLWPRYFNSRNAEFVVEREDKNKSAREHGVTICLDDETDVLEALTAVPHRFLLDPFDVHEDKSAMYTRLASWDEFRKTVEALTVALP